MEFIQKPDTLTFAATMPDFIVSGVQGSAKVTLKKGSEDLLSETMFKSERGLVIDVKKVVNDSLRVKVPNEVCFYQNEAMGYFTLTVESDGQVLEYSFNAIRGGYEGFSIPSTYNAIEVLYSFQPATKVITTESPEWLTFFCTSMSTLRLRFRYYNSVGNLIEYALLPSPVTTAGDSGLYSIGCSYENARGYLPPPGVIDFAFYDVDMVSVSDDNITPVTPTQRFLITQATNAHKYYLFENTLGGIDTLICTGDLTRRISMSSDITMSDEIKDDSSNIHSLSFEQSVGIFSSEIELMWFRDFVLSSQRYEVENDSLYKIIIEDTDTEISLANADIVSFTFRRATEDKYSGFIRQRLELPTGLIFDGPDDTDFF